MRSYFENKYTFPNPKTRISSELLYCSGGHAILVEYMSEDNDRKTLTCCPVDHSITIPHWLPEIFHSTYTELMSVRSDGNKRSVVSLCGIMLEAEVNILLKNPGEKKKSLFDRLVALKNQGLIDNDQFSSGTIARITRNEVMHPKEIMEEIEHEEVEKIFDEVMIFLERSYKFRSSKALPEGTSDSSNEVA
jgi:hypothetical protein